VDDLQLSKAVLAGDAAAEELFDKKYRPRLFKAAAYFLGPRDPETEDVVQQALLIAFQKLDSYDPSKASLYTWMARITVNLCYQRLDKRRREQATAHEDLEAVLAPLAERGLRDADERALKEARLSLLRRGLARLGEACAKLLRLRDQDGMSYADLGRAIKAPIGTVMSRLSRCREQLKAWVLAQPEAR
jgi:RNA polymerase sigma-70 factor (ECF subfamily)